MKNKKKILAITYSRSEYDLLSYLFKLQYQKIKGIFLKNFFLKIKYLFKNFLERE